jgi:voltage-gated potassium channel Kch
MLYTRFERRVATVLLALTLRKAMVLIVGVATTLAFSAAILVHFVDRNIGTFGDALWWAVSTVTTVGYGDVVPTSTPGRIAGALLMLTGIALIPVITSVAVSVLVSQRTREAREEEVRDLQLIMRRLDAIERRFESR